MKEKRLTYFLVFFLILFILLNLSCSSAVIKFESGESLNVPELKGVFKGIKYQGITNCDSQLFTDLLNQLLPLFEKHTKEKPLTLNCEFVKGKYFGNIVVWLEKWTLSGNFKTKSYYINLKHIRGQGTDYQIMDDK